MTQNRPRRMALLPALAGPATAPARATEPAAVFVDILPSSSGPPVRLNARQVARLGGTTILDTTAFVQQRSSEPLEALAQRLIVTGMRFNTDVAVRETVAEAMAAIARAQDPRAQDPRAQDPRATRLAAPPRPRDPAPSPRWSTV